jgi:hypothetical protein
MLQYPLQLPPLALPSPKHPRSPFALSLTANFSNPSTPSTPSARLSKSPYISSRQSSTRPVSIPNAPTLLSHPSTSASFHSSLLDGVLSQGDLVGEGSLLQGEPIRRVSIGPGIAPTRSSDYKEPAKEFQVVRRLGAGSYAVVYLVQEVISRPPPSEDGHMSTIGQMELDNRPSETLYGREYAIKCLSKANLDEEALAAQMTEVRLSFFLFALSCLPVSQGDHPPVSQVPSKHRHSPPDP